MRAEPTLLDVAVGDGHEEEGRGSSMRDIKEEDVRHLLETQDITVA